jgi:hypothetical protein
MLYQFDTNSPASAARVPIQSPAAFGIKEKDIEKFFAAHLHELITEDQLMLIGQERQRQEEADVFALDRKGTLYIFELKRWQSAAENLLQVMRYGQIFGRYNYSALQDLARRLNKLKGELSEKHKAYFELAEALPEAAFNQDQVFIVVTNGVDRDTLDAIKYWKQKGLRIDSLTYRIYKMEGRPYLWFDVYNPEQDVIIEENPGIYCVNTNATYMANAWSEMLTKKRASAYYGRKYAVAGIPKGSTVYLYHTGVGVIAKGKTTGTFQKTDYEGDAEAEFFVPLEFDWMLGSQGEWEQAVRAREVNQALGTGHRFRQTSFGVSKKMADAIDELWLKKRKLPTQCP